MRVALISDIHANFEALAVLSDILESADQVVCLGDLVGYYCEVNEAIEYVRSLNPICVMGNHDSFVLHGCPQNLPPAVRFGIDFARSCITSDNLSWLAHLPFVWGGELAARSFLLVHGSPWRPLDEYLYPNSQNLTKLAAFNFDIIAFGHTHRAMQRITTKPYLLNPGSVGQSRDIKAHACAYILETDDMETLPITRPYNAEHAVDLALKAGAGQWIGKHLR